MNDSRKPIDFCEDYRKFSLKSKKLKRKKGMSGEQNTYRICKKCLMRELQDKTEYYESIGALIERLDPDTKASEELYEERLQICKECEMFLEAMCRSCGCYVELRAAVTKNSCPRKKW